MRFVVYNNYLQTIKSILLEDSKLKEKSYEKHPEYYQN